MPLNLSTRDLLLLVGLPAITDFTGSLVASNAAGNAAGAQIEATERASEINRQASREALDLQRQIYNDQIQRNEPYRQGGLGAFSKLLSYSGLPVPAMTQPAGIPARGSTGPQWTPPPASRPTSGSAWVPGAINAAGTLGSFAMMGGGGGAAGGAIGTLNPATGALATGSSGLGTLGALATNPFTIGAAAAGIGVASWLKSQAHWEANDIVKTFENPFHQQFLAPLSQAVNSGKISPDDAVRALDENWMTYQQAVDQWAGNSSDRKKVAQQSKTNPKLLQTIEGIRQAAMGMQPQTANMNAPADGSFAPGAPMPSSRDQWMARAERYRRVS